MNDFQFYSPSSDENYFLANATDEINFLCRKHRLTTYFARAVFNLNPDHPLLTPDDELPTDTDSPNRNILLFSHRDYLAFLTRKIACFQAELVQHLGQNEEIWIPTFGFFAQPTLSPWHSLEGDGSGQLQVHIFFCIPADESVEVRLSDMEESGELEELWCDVTNGSEFSLRFCEDLVTDLERAIRAIKHNLALLEPPIRLGYTDEQLEESFFGLAA